MSRQRDESLVESESESESGPESLVFLARAVDDHAREHRYDAEKQLAAGRDRGISDGLSRSIHIEDRRALVRRSACHAVEASLLGGRKFPGTLGNVEDDGGRGSIELVAEMSTAPRHLLEDFIGREEESEGRPCRRRASRERSPA